MFAYLKLWMLFILSIFGCLYLMAKSKNSKSAFAFLFLAVVDIEYMLVFISLKMEFYGFFPFPANTLHGIGIIFCIFLSLMSYALPGDLEKSKYIGFFRLVFVLFVFGLMAYVLINLSGQDLSYIANKYLREFYDYISNSRRR